MKKYLFVLLLLMSTSLLGQGVSDEDTATKYSNIEGPQVVNGDEIKLKTVGINYAADFKNVFYYQGKYYAIANQLHVGYFWGIIFNSYNYQHSGVLMMELDTQLNYIDHKFIDLYPKNRTKTCNVHSTFMLDSQLMIFFTLDNKLKGKTYLMVKTFDVITNKTSMLKIAEIPLKSKDYFSIKAPKNEPLLIINHVNKDNPKSELKEYCSIDKNLNIALKQSNTENYGELLHSEFLTDSLFEISLYRKTQNGKSEYIVVKDNKKRPVSYSLPINPATYRYHSVESDTNKNRLYFVFTEHKANNEITNIDVSGLDFSSRKISSFYTKNFSAEKINESPLFRFARNQGYMTDISDKSYKKASKKIRFATLKFDPLTRTVCMFHEYYEYYTTIERVETKHYSTDSRGNRTYTNSTYDNKTIDNYRVGPFIATFLNREDGNVPQAFVGSTLSRKHFEPDNQIQFIKTQNGATYLLTYNRVYTLNASTITFEAIKIKENGKEKFYNFTSAIPFQDKLFVIHKRGFKRISFSMMAF